MDDLISRQAAIDALDGICDRECEYPKKQRAVMCAACHLESAFDAINELPSAERREVQSSECEYWDDESNFCALNRPSAERHGRWVDIEHAPNGLLYATCSVCGKRQTIEATNYCGKCGAKMSEDNATQYTECEVKLYTETKLRFVLDECIKDEELIEKILQALDEVGE